MLLIGTVVSSLADDKSGTSLRLKVDLAYVFSDNTKAYNLNSAKEADDGARTCPTLYCIPPKITYKGIDDHDETEERYQDTCACYHPYGLDRKARYAVKGKCQHLG